MIAVNWTYLYLIICYVQMKTFLLYEQYKFYIYNYNHNYNKIVKSDWLSTALISALIGQFNRTVCVMPK